jgi:hypothetical protein
MLRARHPVWTPAQTEVFAREGVTRLLDCGKEKTQCRSSSRPPSQASGGLARSVLATSGVLPCAETGSTARRVGRTSPPVTRRQRHWCRVEAWARRSSHVVCGQLREDRQWREFTAPQASRASRRKSTGR